jgi:hypothetical protein
MLKFRRVSAIRRPERGVYLFLQPTLAPPNVGQRPAAATCLCRTAHVAGSPVELPQAIQHRGFDAVFGVTRKDVWSAKISAQGGMG